MARQRRFPPVRYDRDQAREVECPICRQMPGRPCLGYYRQVRTANHLDRYWARYWRDHPRRAA